MNWLDWINCIEHFETFWKYCKHFCTVGCINFNFFGNIKNRQPAYASLGSLEDPNFFFFFAPKTMFSWPPKVLYFWKFAQSLLAIFSSFLFLGKGQERTYIKHKKKLKIGFENFFKFFFKSLKRVKNRNSKMGQLFTKMSFFKKHFTANHS